MPSPDPEEVIRQTQPWLLSFVRRRAPRMLRDRESCSDVVQSTYREYTAEQGRFRFVGAAALRQWLRTTALRKIVDRVRYLLRARRNPGREADAEACDILAADAPSPSQEAAFREQLARIEQALGRLDREDRDLITLVKLQGVDYATVARRLQITADAARMRTTRALARLAHALELRA